MSEFFAMDGDGVWVWSAWGLVAAGLTGLVVFAFLERRAVRERLRRLEEE
jgi:heme exporter protein CcmD